MGGVCCDRRPKLPDEPIPESQHERPRKNSAHGPTRRKSRRKLPHKAQSSAKQPTWKNYFGKAFAERYLKTDGPQQPEESESSFSDDDDESFSIDYELNSAKRMTMVQRNSIIEVLDRFQIQQGEEREHFDSYSDGVQHLESGETVECTIGITSHALYILDREDFRVVKQRVLVGTITGLVIDSLVSVALIMAEDSTTVLISSHKMVDIVKALQSIYRESKHAVIPWKIE